MTTVSKEALAQLPTAIWIPVPFEDNEEPPVYRGTPLEMVREMATEMEEDDLEVAVDKILQSLAEHRGVSIRLPRGLPDDSLSGLFVLALLETGIGRPLPLA